MQRAGVHIKCTEPVRETCFGGNLGSQSQAVSWVRRSAPAWSQLQNDSDGESSSVFWLLKSQYSARAFTVEISTRVASYSPVAEH